jgi:hypothetical protein
MTQNESGEQPAISEQQEAILQFFKHVQQALQEQFDEYGVEGQIGQHPVYGTMFAYTLNRDGKTYSCGFFLNELARNFQSKDNPAMWLSSFFVDLIRSPDSRPLPNPPQTEEEAKALFDGYIVPHCAKSIRDEFPDEQVYVDLELHPEHGPVLEAGFPAVKEGNNTCAMPLHYLLTLYLLNRDPADPLIQAMYRLYEENQLGAVKTE